MTSSRTFAVLTLIALVLAGCSGRSASPGPGGSSAPSQTPTPAPSLATPKASAEPTPVPEQTPTIEWTNVSAEGSVRLEFRGESVERVVIDITDRSGELVAAALGAWFEAEWYENAARDASAANPPGDATQLRLEWFDHRGCAGPYAITVHDDPQRITIRTSFEVGTDSKGGNCGVTLRFDGELAARDVQAELDNRPFMDRIPIDSIVAVVTDGLRVRSLPGTGDESKRLSPLLDAPQQVFVVDGPVPASGYDWYQVQPIDGGFVLGGPFGWVAAAGHDGEPWLSPRPLDCPDLPRTFQRFQATPGVVWLACYGGGEINFPALAMRPEATCGADVGWTIDPEWLYSTCPHPELLLLRPKATTGDDAYEVVLEPGVDSRRVDPGVTPASGVDVVVTGHHDHAEARQCRVRAYETWAIPEFTPEQAVLACRAQFVVTAIEVVEP